VSKPVPLVVCRRRRHPRPAPVTTDASAEVKVPRFTEEVVAKLTGLVSAKGGDVRLAVNADGVEMFVVRCRNCSRDIRLWQNNLSNFTARHLPLCIKRGHRDLASAAAKVSRFSEKGVASLTRYLDKRGGDVRVEVNAKGVQKFVVRCRSCLRDVRLVKISPSNFTAQHLPRCLKRGICVLRFPAEVVARWTHLVDQRGGDLRIEVNAKGVELFVVRCRNCSRDIRLGNSTWNFTPLHVSRCFKRRCRDSGAAVAPSMPSTSVDEKLASVVVDAPALCEPGLAGDALSLDCRVVLTNFVTFLDLDLLESSS
jgi:hypothetical protein